MSAAERILNELHQLRLVCQTVAAWLRQPVPPSNAYLARMLEDAANRRLFSDDDDDEPVGVPHGGKKRRVVPITEGHRKR